MMQKIEQDAIQIATHIRNDDLNIAKDYFYNAVSNLKYFEAVILRNKSFRYSNLDTDNWIKLTQWKKKLTKAELKHCRDMNMTSLAEIKKTQQYQQKMKDEGSGLACHKCLSIFNKLGI